MKARLLAAALVVGGFSASGPFTPVGRNMRVDRMTVGKAASVFFIRGLEPSPVRGVVVRDSSFRGVARGSREERP